MNEQRNIRKTVVAAVMLSLLSIAAAAGIVWIARNSRDGHGSKVNGEHDINKQSYVTSTLNCQTDLGCVPDFAFASGDLYVFFNEYLDVCDLNGKCTSHTTGHKVVKADGGKKSMYFIDENKDLYSFDMKTDKSRKLLGGVCDISVGNWVNGAVTEDGKLYLWGENAGHYVAGSSPVNEPTEYKSDVHWVDIESGLQYLLLLDDKGNVYESRTTEDTYPIKKIDALKDIESIYCCSEKIAVSKNGHINYWKGDFGSDRYNSSKKIESVLNGLKPTSFRLGAEYSIAIVGDEAYFWGCFGPSKYNKGMDDVLSPKYDSGLTDFDDIYCGSFTFVRKGKTVRIYKR